jgi:phosphate:Na+ symporter
MLLFLLGIFLFLIGLEGCKKSLKNITSLKIEKYITKKTEKLWVSIMIGVLATAILQSSSAFSVIVIGLIAIELLKFRSGLAMVMGANIGTTITVQIISLPVLTFYPYLIICGSSLILFSFLIKMKYLLVGFIILNFGILFAGLNLMTKAFDSPVLYQFFKGLIHSINQNSILAIFSGGVSTAIIQSSSAVTALVVSLITKDIINLKLAVAVALGSNIGTCITAFLASISGGKQAKSLALGHFIFNVMGVLFFLPFFKYFIFLISLTNVLPARQLANAHTLFNIITLLLFLPFYDTFVSFLKGDHL